MKRHTNTELSCLAMESRTSTALSHWWPLSQALITSRRSEQRCDLRASCRGESATPWKNRGVNPKEREGNPFVKRKASEEDSRIEVPKQGCHFNSKPKATSPSEWELGQQVTVRGLIAHFFVDARLWSLRKQHNELTPNLKQTLGATPKNLDGKHHHP